MLPTDRTFLLSEDTSCVLMFDLSSARIVDASSSQDSVVFTIHELHSLSEPLTFVVTLLAAQL